MQPSTDYYYTQEKIYSSQNTIIYLYAVQLQSSRQIKHRIRSQAMQMDKIFRVALKKNADHPLRPVQYKWLSSQFIIYITEFILAVKSD